jgi:hypothetical protein
VIEEKPISEMSTWEKLRDIILKICLTPLFQWIITLSIVGNTICLALDKYPADSELQ